MKRTYQTVPPDATENAPFGTSAVPAIAGAPTVEKGVASLDTLAQLGTSPDFNDLRLISGTEIADQEKLKNRARAKYFSTAVIMNMVDLGSPLTKSYWNTYHCCNKIEVVAGKATANYCKNRWCQTCARIKTADLISRYKDTLYTWEDRHFVTLTYPNMPAEWLPQQLKVMQKEFKKIQEMMKHQDQRGTGERLIAVRKLECTYNPRTNDYHPHYHVITKTRSMGSKLLSEWLKRFPVCSALGQDIRPASRKDLVELFKYFTKVITKVKGENRQIYPEALDIIFQSIKGKRTFQPIGFQVPKTEEPEEIDTEDELIQAADEAVIYEWNQQFHDWISPEGEVLADYEPDKTLSDLVRKISPQAPF